MKGPGGAGCLFPLRPDAGIVMLVYPKVGEFVQVCYADANMPLHGLCGFVEIVGRGPGPRNHLVRIGDRKYAIPCGNLRRPRT